MQECQRVRISPEYHWAQGATGSRTNHSRKLNTPKGEVTFYWVKFDSPQFDADGDGPYSEAEIDERFIEAI